MQKVSDASKWSSLHVKQKVTLNVCGFGQLSVLEVMALLSAHEAFKPCRELS